MSRRRTLRPDEHEIWQSVARTAKPMHKPLVFPEVFEPPMITSLPTPPPLPKFQVGQAVKLASRTDVAPLPSAHLAKSPLRMDAKTHAKMTRGKLAPEARIDLHGMTLDQAHPALISFILSSQAAGLRLVLVITGKGKARAEHGPVMGVLRRQVPNWLHMPPLSSAILQVREAHITHGGGGALYVYLRRG